MKSLRSVLEEKFKDKKYEKDFYRGLEKTRVAVEITMHREKAGLTQEELADKLENFLNPPSQGLKILII